MEQLAGLNQQISGLYVQQEVHWCTLAPVHIKPCESWERFEVILKDIDN